MGKVAPIAVGEKSAARMMEIPLDRFLDLVRNGSLPQPKPIAPGIERWSVADLQAVLDGTKMDDDDISW